MDQFEHLINGMFEKKKEEPKEEVVPVEEVKPLKGKKQPTRKVNIPEPPQQTKEQQQAAMKHGKQEMELIRQAFLDFSEKVNDTVIYSYLYPYVEDFVEVCKDMQSVVEDDIDKDKLTEKGLNDYERFRKLRSRILSSIYDKYENDK